LNIEDNPKEIQRRDFFGALFAKIVEPLAGAVEEKIGQIESLTAKMLPQEKIPAGPPPLRPPGVLNEEQLLKHCQRTGECIKICPVQAIRPLQHPDPRMRETPHLVPEVQACVLCEDLPCISACPSGALLPVAREKVRIGLAVVHYDLCLRVDGEDCRECLAICPLGEAAIRLDEHSTINILAEGCTGCGLCAMTCPSAMRAISIIPPIFARME